MKHKNIMLLSIVAFLSCLLCSAQAVEVFSDDFDSGNLSNWEELPPQNTSGMEYNISGSELIVKDIIGSWIINETFNGEWALITLLHDLQSPLTNFHLELQFSWSSDNPETDEQSVKAMQRIYLQTYGETDLIARAGFSDAWIGARGGKVAKISGDKERDAMQNELGFSGSAEISITRLEGNITVRWDEETLLGGRNTEPLHTIGLLFYYYPYDGAGGPSFFGTESVDLVLVDDTTDVPTTSSTTITPIPTPGAESTTTGTGFCALSQIYGEGSEKLELLRYVRDSVLSQTAEGQELIRLYYEWSPVIVRAMEQNEEFKEEVKEMIDGLLPMIEVQ